MPERDLFTGFAQEISGIRRSPDSQERRMAIFHIKQRVKTQVEALSQNERADLMQFAEHGTIPNSLKD